MRIKRIDVYQRNLNYVGGEYKLSGGRSFSVFDATLVCISTECGLSGWGESTPFGSSYIDAHAAGVRAGIQVLAPRLIGRDPRQVDRNYELMDDCLVANASSKAPLDIACWDLFGQSAGLPVYDLLGGSTAKPLPLISSIPADTPKQMRENVQHHRDAGYLGHSIKVGASIEQGGPSLDAERIVQALADRQRGELFLVDANGGLSVEHAVQMLQLLPNDCLFILEAPCATWEETNTLRSRVKIPIMLDELITSDRDIVRIIATGVADGVGLKLSKNGGITAGRRQRDICAAAGLMMSVQDTVGSEIAFAAVAHLAHSVPTTLLRCVLDTRDMVKESLAEFDCSKTPEGILAPNIPGLGIVPKVDTFGAPIMSFA